MITNYAASVHARLLNEARAKNVDFNALLARYAIERLLYRLSQLPEADSFVLKGATLFTLWQGAPHRPTKDVDLHGRGRFDLAGVTAVFASLCAVEFPPDAIVFDASTIEARRLGTEDGYQVIRVTLLGRIGRARIPTRVDIGFGDAITPSPLHAELPSVLPLPRARLLAYPREAVVAEKLHAIVRLGMATTRLKDYFDLDHLATHFEFDGPLLARAIRNTFERRRTAALSTAEPIGLSDTFAHDPSRIAAWNAFRRRIGVAPAPLQPIVARVRSFVLPPLYAAATEPGDMEQFWARGGPWELQR